MCRKGTAGSWRLIVGRTIAQTRLFFIALLAAELVARAANAPTAVAGTIHVLFVIMAVIQGAIWTRELILGLVEHRAGPMPDESSLGSAMGIIRLLVSTALFIIALILILDNIGVNVTGLVAGLGIGGIAIGLAAQGIFSDLFAALSILFDKPFKRGDLVSWDTNSGHVEQIGLKTTRVRSLAGEEIVVSNANLLNKELRNFARIEWRRVETLLGLVYQTPIETMEQLGSWLADIVESQGNCHLVRAVLKGFGASSIDFELIYDVRSSEPLVMFQTREAVNIAILKLFADKGIEFAYPTQTTFTAAPDGTMVMPYAGVPAPIPSRDDKRAVTS